jgi:hypothetical protein
MPYALVPDGYTLKKVNQGELEAVNRHNRAITIRRFTGSRNSSVIFIVAAAVGFFFLAKQIKLPTFSLKDSILTLLGLKGQLSAEGAKNIDILLTQGALALDPDASTLLQTLYPTPEQRLERKESQLGIGGALFAAIEEYKK